MLDTEFEKMAVMQDPNIEITAVPKVPIAKPYEDLKAENAETMKKFFPSSKKKNVKLKQVDSKVSKMSEESVT